MYSEHEGSQDKKIVMIGVRKGPQEGRCGTKRRNKENSAAQEENHNSLMANLVLLNLTLFLMVHFHAVHGHAATHMHITHVLCFSSILPPPCDCTMLIISTMPALNSISRFNTNMYIQYDSI